MVNGSFLIFKMFKKYIAALDGKRTPFPFIHEVFDEIQTELQQEGKQLPESVWNDGTRYLVFKKRDVVVDNKRIVFKNTKECMLEMVQTKSVHQTGENEMFDLGDTTTSGMVTGIKKSLVNEDTSMSDSIAMKIMFDSDCNNEESEKESEIICDEKDSNLSTIQTLTEMVKL